MPFTIGGDYIPNKKEPEDQGKAKSNKPVKVRVQKRGKVLVTCILNLKQNPEELKSLARELKQCCGSGGTIRNDSIEIQGDHATKLKSELHKRGIKAQ